jgi:hypothetical protein
MVLRNVHTGSGVHPAGTSPGLRQPGPEADHLRLVLRLRMNGAIPPPLYAFVPFLNVMKYVYINSG